MLAIDDCQSIAHQTFFATDDQAYNCTTELLTEKAWDKIRQKAGPKNLVIQGCKQVVGKGWEITYATLPPGIKPVGTDTRPDATYFTEAAQVARTAKVPVLAKGPWPEVDCCNEWVALVRITIDTGKVIIPEGASIERQEGFVIGVGPGAAVNGVRVPSQLKYGDKVMFSGNPGYSLETTGTDKKKVRVDFISERNIICKIPE